MIYYDRHRLEFMTENLPCYNFLLIEEWNACRIFSIVVKLEMFGYLSGGPSAAWEKSASAVLAPPGKLVLRRR